jgi:hypothetical protein
MKPEDISGTRKERISERQNQLSSNKQEEQEHHRPV